MLRTLAAEPAARAEVIRQLYEDPESREVAELLMDQEEDRRVKADVMEALNEPLMESHPQIRPSRLPRTRAFRRTRPYPHR